jgi:copper chaperone CopZ
MSRFLKISSAIIFLLLQLNVRADLLWVQLGVDGLTCSQCCRSVELSLRRLEFVNEVKMDLESTEARITFKPGLRVSVDRIARAVTDAGFSVRFLKGGLLVNNLDVKENSCYKTEEGQLQFVKTGNKLLNGEVALTFLGKDFLSRNGYKQWKDALKLSCAAGSNKLYFVTL